MFVLIETEIETKSDYIQIDFYSTFLIEQSLKISQNILYQNHLYTL